MGEDLAGSNVNRAYSLAATSLAIFTFVLFFLYPRYATREVGALPFQATLVVMGLATFGFVFASLHYYSASLADWVEGASRLARRGDRFWLLGFTLLFLAPSMLLFAVGLRLVGAVWLALWLMYLLFMRQIFPLVHTAGSDRGGWGGKRVVRSFQ